MSAMRFKEFGGDVNWLLYGGKWVSPKLNNGDWDYWLVIEFINMDEACGRDNEGQPPYHINLCAVSPAAAGEEAIAEAADSHGLTLDNVKSNDLAQVEVLHSYGIRAVLWQNNGYNAHGLLSEAKRQAICCEGMFGFYMDGPQNKIGSTGWEFIKGDMQSGLARCIASGSTEGRILAKMHGINPDEVKP